MQRGVLQFLDERQKNKDDDSSTNAENSDVFNGRVIKYAIKWSKGLDPLQWAAIQATKAIVRDRIRKESTEAIDEESAVIQKLKEEGVVVGLIGN